MNPDPASLDRLHDVIVPPAVPFWPPAPGWYWLLAFAALAVAWGACRALIKWQRGAYRREAIAEWKECHALLCRIDRRREVVERLAALMKRVALTVRQRKEVAALSEMQWSEYLGKRWGDLGVNMERLSYAPQMVDTLAEAELAAMAVQVKEWIATFGETEQTPC